MQSIVRRVSKPSSSVISIRLYLAKIQGENLIHQTQQGIKRGLALAIQEGDELDAEPRDSDEETRGNVWIPLAIVRDALPAFVGRGDEYAREIAVSNLLTRTKEKFA